MWAGAEPEAGSIIHACSPAAGANQCLITPIVTLPTHIAQRERERERERVREWRQREERTIEREGDGEREGWIE